MNTLNIDELARRMTSDSTLEAAHAALAELPDGGESSALLDVWQVLGTLADKGAVPRARCELASDVVLERLALAPGKDRVASLLTLLARDAATRKERTRPRELLVRALASRLGYAQPKETLVSLLASAGDEPDRTELLACWMHEVVLAGHPLEHEPAAKAFHAELVRTGHPLGALPLALLDEEREATTYLPMYGADAVDVAAKVLERGPASTHTLPPPDGEAAPVATLRDEPEVVARITAAVASWSSGAGSQLEARVFSLEPLLEAGLGRRVLRSLPLESARGEGLAISSVLTDVAWGALFAAAANGGASSQGMGGAYGRLAAWTSLGALVGLPAAAPVADVARASARAAFAMFSGTAFFRDEAWDLGVLALRPDHASLAVLAATDGG